MQSVARSTSVLGFGIFATVISIILLVVFPAQLDERKHWGGSSPGFTQRGFFACQASNTADIRNSCFQISEAVDIAGHLLSYWRNQTRLHLRQLKRSSSTDIVTELQRAGVISSHDYCYVKFLYDGNVVKPVSNFSSHCYAKAKQMDVRKKAYATLFTGVLQQDWRPRLEKFEFFVDLTDGTRNNVRLFKALNIPILSLGRNPFDVYTVPIPDPHMVLGIFSWTAPYNFSSRYVESSGFSKGMYNRYTSSFNTSWKAKIPKAVYRGWVRFMLRKQTAMMQNIVQ